jgi:putative transposase
MQFDSGHIYHIFNQGNNRQKIFFDRENYLFFLRKIRTHVIPFADILAWCLMPNHFHLMVYVNHAVVDEQLIISDKNPSATQSRARIDDPEIPATIPGPTRSRTRNPISFNKSIGIMLASYTRAINKQQNWSGSIFRSETKAVCLTELKSISPAWTSNMGITQITVHDSDVDYPNICFNYILNNPVKDNLVTSQVDWEFSSSSDFLGIRNGGLINRIRIEEFGLRML